MCKKSQVFALIVLALTPMSMVYAHDYHDQPGGPGFPGPPGPHWQEHHQWRGDDRGFDRRPPPHHYQGQPDFVYGGHHFRPGGRYPQRYYQDRYWVNDWHGCGLGAPPPGHRWANIDGNYVLIAVATGVITSLILNH
ncbi:RcnB family protein [Rosenbergiella australiborealis]|nr:RcnB family protein [Rosenbergiella australiborealis]